MSWPCSNVQWRWGSSSSRGGSSSEGHTPSCSANWQTGRQQLQHGTTSRTPRSEQHAHQHTETGRTTCWLLRYRRTFAIPACKCMPMAAYVGEVEGPQAVFCERRQQRQQVSVIQGRRHQHHAALLPLAGTPLGACWQLRAGLWWRLLAGREQDLGAGAYHQLRVLQAGREGREV
jgi:hypothetical protein